GPKRGWTVSETACSYALASESFSRTLNNHCPRRSRSGGKLVVSHLSVGCSQPFFFEEVMLKIDSPLDSGQSGLLLPEVHGFGNDFHSDARQRLSARPGPYGS